MEDELNNVKKFAVILSGENYRIRVSKRDWLFRNRVELKDVAFMTTRFVQARTEDEAAAVAIEMVMNELEEMGRSTKESTVKIEEIWEDEANYDLKAPGAGFSFAMGGFSEEEPE